MASIDDDDELRATRKLNGVEWKEDKEIEVGEYCRSESGQIRKVTRIIPCYENGKLLNNSYYIEFDGLGNISTYKNNLAKKMFIKKHSQNLIDLIEVGDYIKSEDGIEGKVDLIAMPLKIFVNGEEVLEGEIKTIVTHEQFNSVMYKVKE